LPRGRAIPAIVVGVVVFLAISALLARFLSTENTERDDVLAVLSAQARGDVAGILAGLDRCGEQPACVATERKNALALRRPGSVKILSLKSPTAYSLTGASGRTRVAWTVIGRLPVVQCVEVRRTGSALAGMTVSLRYLSAPIPNEATC
jgi:hypothetical protein